MKCGEGAASVAVEQTSLSPQGGEKGILKSPRKSVFAASESMFHFLMLERLAGLAVATAPARFRGVGFSKYPVGENVLEEYPERGFTGIPSLRTLP